MPYAKAVLTIGLTGGIAGGKSAVARLLAARGARVIDADRLVHEAYEPGAPGFEAVVAAFGPQVVAPDGSIDRARLGSLVFGDAGQMARLTSMVWPLARELAEQERQEAAAEGVPVLVIEAPLLIEAGWRDLVDEVWFVRAPLDAVRKRLAQRRGLGPEDIEARITTRQQALAEEAAGADLVIENDSDIESLDKRVEAAWLTLRERGLV